MGMRPMDELSAQVCGRVVRFTWNNGPTKGTTHEHTFHADGTVEWRPVHGGKSAEAQTPTDVLPGVKAPERPRYVASKLSDDLCLISYHSESGYTLTVVMHFRDFSTIAIASNDKNWLPIHGSFELMR